MGSSKGEVKPSHPEDPPQPQSPAGGGGAEGQEKTLCHRQPCALVADQCPADARACYPVPSPGLELPSTAGSCPCLGDMSEVFAPRKPSKDSASRAPNTPRAQSHILGFL